MYSVGFEAFPISAKRNYFDATRWVGGTAEVISKMEPLSSVHYAVLVPNQRGLDDLSTLLSSSTTTPPLSDEISIFTAATDAFCRAKTNTTIAESLLVTRLEPVTRDLRVRGYVSVVIACPCSGSEARARCGQSISRYGLLRGQSWGHGTSGYAGGGVRG
jgi:hydroxymethylglutaryl-CoA lyase